MHYELWALNTGNLIRDYATEAEALEMVRELLAVGWSVDDLGLTLDFDEGEDGDDAALPPAISGHELASRMHVQALSERTDPAQPSLSA